MLSLQKAKDEIISAMFEQGVELDLNNSSINPDIPNNQECSIFWFPLNPK